MADVPNAPWQLHLLGRPHLLRPGGQEVPCPARLMLILAYVALEGRSARLRLASAMWPETSEASARNNLVHALRRLRVLCGAEVVRADRDVELAPEVRVDVAPLLSGEALNSDPPPDLSAPLLDGLEFDVATEIADWVEVWRERVVRLAAEHLRRLVDELQASGDLRLALEQAELWLRLDPVSEDAHRTRMRLHHLNGDRAAALRAYQTCVDLIRQEFGTEPSLETVALAHDIEEQGGSAPPRPPTSLPLAVLRPPVLVGRAQVWQRMEEAWEKGQLIFVSGSPGIGKTRLLQDFARLRGPHIWLEGHPGDLAVPYSTIARVLRTYLRSNPGAELPGYILEEGARILPEWVSQRGPPPPVQDQEAKLRFYTALGDAIALTTQGASAVVMDDWQFNDDASADFGTYFASRTYPLAPGKLGPPGLIAFRTGKLRPSMQVLLDGILAGGLGIHIELGALNEPELRELVRSLDVPQILPRLQAVMQLTGGNPQFVQETVRYLLESGLKEGEPLALPPRIQEVLTQRLDHLSGRALQVARAASVLQQDFTVELVGEVLGLSLFDVAAAWEELEARQIMNGERFSHDLLLQAVAADIPMTIRRLLHRSAARTLEQWRPDASRIAQHWEAGDVPAQAAQWYRTAADIARAAFRLKEAEEFLRRAEALA